MDNTSSKTTIIGDNTGWQCPSCLRIWNPRVDICKYCFQVPVPVQEEILKQRADINKLSMLVEAEKWKKQQEIDKQVEKNKYSKYQEDYNKPAKPWWVEPVFPNIPETPFWEKWSIDKKLT